MADKRAYFKVDVGYFTNPKVAVVMAESTMAIILHLESIAYAAQHLTDGLVPIALIRRLVGAEDSDATLLFDSGLWDATGRRGFAQVHHYLEHQRSADTAKQLSDAGRKGAAGRWQKSDSDADGIDDGMRTPMPRKKEREKEDTDASFDAWWAIYPKKVGKGQALKAYRAASKKTTTDNLAASLQKQLPWFAAQVKPDGDFRPQASTWLNGERWGDELDTPAGPGKSSAWDRARRNRAGQ
jgi:hypothetical protein